MFLKGTTLPTMPSLAVDRAQRNADEPYRYQRGFGNHHVSESIPGALPRNGTNMPQQCPYGLYPEHLNGTSFISSRETVSNVWMYRVKPGVVHKPLTPSKARSRIESCFLPTNPNVTFTPLSHTWGPLAGSKTLMTNGGPLTNGNSRGIHFVAGLKTLAGHGDATLREGLAVHQYAFDADMVREAFVNNDGEMLFVPSNGTLDLQTELGHLRVRPGDIAVVPPGIRFAVRTAEESAGAGTEPASCTPAVAKGYVLELFGSHFALPDLGPLGANGLAHVRDFEYPEAAFDVDHPSPAPPSGAVSTPSRPPWTITVKLAGRLYAYTQPHTPFDVVAWHGRCAPYRYRLARFAHLTANTDQLDPTAYAVLTAPGRRPGVSLVDFCVFGEKWAVAADTVRLPYYHRTMAAELCGVVAGAYRGSVRPLEVGGLSFESAYMPHGESYEAWRREVAKETLGPELAGAGFLAFMFHISAHVGLTRWATEDHPDIRPDKPDFWDNFKADFEDYIPEANRSLARAGLPLRSVPDQADEQRRGNGVRTGEHRPKITS